MTRYDPKVYDPAKLTGEDAATFDGFALCGQSVLDWLEEMSENGATADCVPLFGEIYRHVARDIRQRVADLLDAERTELTVSLMEADPERYAVE